MYALYRHVWTNVWDLVRTVRQRREIRGDQGKGGATKKVIKKK